MINIIFVAFYFINNDRVFEDMSSRRSFTLFPKLARVDFSISSFMFETSILVYGLMILNRRYIIVGTSFLMIPPSSAHSYPPR